MAVTATRTGTERSQQSQSLVGHEAAGSGSCCCCSAAVAVVGCSVVTFVLGVALLLVGVFVTQTVQDWGVPNLDMLGWLGVALGGFLTIVSLLGICAARTGSMLVRFVYFVALLLAVCTLLVACICSAVERAKLESYLRRHWGTVTRNLGLDDNLTLEAAVEQLREYALGLAGVGGSAIALVLISFFSAMRLLGIRQIALCFLATLGFLGLAEIAVAVLTYEQVPLATTTVLTGCAGVQILCALTSFCGLRWLNSECVWCSFLVMLLSIAGLGFIAGSTYLWLRNDSELDQPHHLLIVFGITLVSDAANTFTLLFVGILYCRSRAAFAAADRAAELRIEVCMDRAALLSFSQVPHTSSLRAQPCSCSPAGAAIS